MRSLLSILLLTFSSTLVAEWVEYTTRLNGDVYFYDDARVEKDGYQINVWSRVRYKTSVMGASSYQSNLRLNCSENLETTLQSTFYSDKDWNTPAMATNFNVKPEKKVKSDSATGLLIEILCKNDKG